MTSIRSALALGALAAAAGLVGTQTAWAQAGRRTAPRPVPVAPTPIATLLSAGSATPVTFMPATTPFTIMPAAGAGPVGRRPPISQPIPGPVINN